MFCSVLGHYSWTFDDPLFRLMVLRRGRVVRGRAGESIRATGNRRDQTTRSMILRLPRPQPGPGNLAMRAARPSQLHRI